MPIIGAILGATGSGKTELSILLAQRLNAEIICMDSRQIFKGFKIGTAQPSDEELKAVPHHFAGFLPPEASYSAAEFASDAKELIKQKPDANFILVGGTGLYMQALCLGLNPLPPVSQEIRERLKARYENREQSELYKDALKAKPSIEGKIMPGDTQRLIRVLELKEQCAEEAWDLGERVGGIGSIPSIWLDFPRHELYDRIHRRISKMMRSGWVEEVKELSKTTPANAHAWQSLGYAEIKESLETGKDPFSVEAEIALKSRHYAKRQITWFKHKESPVYIDGKSAKSEDSLKKISEVFQVSSSRFCLDKP